MPESNQSRELHSIFLLILACCYLTTPGSWSSAQEPVQPNGLQDTRGAQSDSVAGEVPASARKSAPKEPIDVQAMESRFFTDVRQRTSAGLRSGEGYFSADGTKMVFQSERSADNPFYQIFLMDFELGDVLPISPGHGKTTCAWIHPDGERIMYASTQEDPQALEKQKAKLAERAAGTESRYSWDYDETYELYSYSLETKSYTRLTHALGYDAEGSYSPDGTKIAFASNRRAYEDGELSERERQLFEFHGAAVMDIYIMDANGSNVQRLTDEEGYDGGPFFSPDGTRICWRHFKTDMSSAEIWTMKIDGTDKQRLTNIQETSFAPFYHPSGEYILFMSNIEGYSNFEIYMIPADRPAAPIRVTYDERFDGFPTFSPDGLTLSWTSNRTDRKSQIFTADWNHQAALEAIGIADAAPGRSESAAAEAVSNPRKEALAAIGATSQQFLPQDVLRHVDYLCRPELAGRMTGSPGEKQATAYVAAYLDSLGFEPAGEPDAGTGEPTWFQSFGFPAGAKLGTHNKLQLLDGKLESSARLGQDWRPLTFSETGEFVGPVVFAGYGIKAPRTDNLEEYDSYTHLPLEGKWVMVFRYLPENVTPQWRQERALYSRLRFKAAQVRDMGGLGLLIVSGPNSQVKRQVIPLSGDSALGKISIPVISISDDLAQQILGIAEQDLAQWQTDLDSGEMKLGFEVPRLQLKANVDVQQLRGTGRNVIGRLRLSPQKDQPALFAQPSVIVGAHIDHLGRGGAGSLAREDEENQIHFGADDNASGIAAILEIAEYISGQKRDGKLETGRDLIVAAWSGEELGLHGSHHFVNTQLKSLKEEILQIPGHESFAEQATLAQRFAAYLNMDMVGRFDGKLVLQGLGSSEWWATEIEKRNLVTGLTLQQSMDTNLPTDASEFNQSGVPILSAFTGSHDDYHTPRDTPDKLNYEKAAQIAKLMGLITRSLLVGQEIPEFQQYEDQQSSQRMAMRVSLGTSPDYTEEVVGVMLKAIRNNSPADKAGIQPRDIVVQLAGTKIENVYDYTNAIGALKVGETVPIVVIRGDKELTLDITPESRD